MNPSVEVRFVQTTDAPAILEIYTPFVRETAISFESEPPDIETFRQRVSTYAEQSPWLVATTEGQIVGYAYGTAHRSRGSYQWNQEVTVYVSPSHQRKGIARLLYQKLLDLLKEMGFYKALAVITLPNDASIRFHEDFGFQHIGDMKKIGFKFGRWYTTSWWDKDLQAEDFAPGKIKSVKSIQHLI